MTSRGLAVWFGLGLATLAVPPGCGGGVVGGECRPGYRDCEGQCIDVRADLQNCGACGLRCDPGESCEGARCVVPGAGGSGGATSDASSGGTTVDAATGGTTTDASTGGVGGTGGVGTGGEPPDASSGGTTADGASGGATSDASSGGAGGDGATGSGGAAVDASTGGTTGDGASDGAPGDASTGGAPPDASSGGAPGDASTGGTSATGGTTSTCVPPFDRPEACGDCTTICSGATPVCAPTDTGHACAPLCTPPSALCGGACVFQDTDEGHCGSCGRVCPSGICQGGQCRGARAGHVILACLDLARDVPSGSPQEQLLGNSLFLPSRSNVRVLVYDQYTRAANRSIVLGVLDRAALARGRQVTVTDTNTALEVTAALDVTKFEALLVLDQPRAPAGRLAEIGAAWQGALASYVGAGGVVVVLAGPGGRAEMPDLVSAAGLLDASGQSLVTGAQLYNRAPADAVGIDVISPFRATTDTCTFTTQAPSDFATVFVVTDSPASSGALGAPVVVHRVIVP